MRQRPVTVENTITLTMPESSKPETQNIFNAPVASVGNRGTQSNVAGVVKGDQIGIQHNYAAEKPDLVATAKEIQQLLEQLSQTYPATTLPGQMTVATKVVEAIERQPTLKARLVGALKAAGTEAFTQAIDHPAVNILVAAIAGWKEVEG